MKEKLKEMFQKKGKGKPHCNCGGFEIVEEKGTEGEASKCCDNGGSTSENDGPPKCC